MSASTAATAPVGSVSREATRADGTLPKEWEKALVPGVKLVSFDLFDTLICRNLGSPDAVFLEVGKRLRMDGVTLLSPEVFARFRRQAEDRARINSRSEEVSLSDIYDELALMADLPCDRDSLVEIEMNVERSSIVALPGMKEMVKRIRERVGRICFTTDIYLPEGLIREVLSGHGFFQEGDGLYVSSTHGLQKFKTGGLFRHLLKEEGVSPSEVLHCGNASVNDVQPASSLGMRTLHLRKGNPVSSEAILEQGEAMTSGLSGRISAAARLTRFEGMRLSGEKEAAWVCGATVAGPLVFSYARWVLWRARKLGLTHLFFLARDAYLPFQAVERIIDEEQSDLKVVYLYGSRPTYYALEVEELGEREWAALTSFAGSGYESLANLSRVLMVKPETLVEVAQAAGVDGNDPERALPGGELEALKRALLDTPELNEKCVGEIREYQDWMRELLGDAGVDENARVGLVDTGWTTRSHAPLYRFVESLGSKQVHLLYLGLAGGQCAVPSDRVETFLFNQHTRTGWWLPEFDYARPLESLLMAPHGRTEGFLLEDGRVKPKLAEPENPEFVEEFYPTYEAAISAFLDNVKTLEPGTGGDQGMAIVAGELIHRFWSKPDDGEVLLWSRLSWEWDPLGHIKYPLARAYRFADVVPAALKGRWPMPYPQFWVGGARVLTTPGVSTAIRCVLAVRRRVKGLVARLPSALSSTATGLFHKLSDRRS